ncbi:MAG: hypothetical protein LBC59_02200 [Chitinispirillales bacterium]|jgi:hypothetical protein|nr:hypothetical protein [Chitinispirillales bacterium]
MFRIGKIRALITVAWLLATITVFGGSAVYAAGRLAPMVSLTAQKASAYEKTLDDARERIDRLKAKGVSVDKITEARIFIDVANRALEENDMAMVKEAIDSMHVHLNKAEEYYRQEAPALWPKIDAAKSLALQAKKELTGYQARKIDSIVGVIDSLQKIDWLFRAKAIGEELTALLPSLKEDEVKAARLKKLVPGEWVFTEKDKSVEDPKVNAVRTSTFKFGTDGKIHLVEKKSGQSAPMLKEDWHFESWGTYGYKGDTIMLSINRFSAIKQMFWRKHMINGKEVWKDEPGPVFDSTITDGSQDRYVTYEDLKEDFKKVR